MGSADLMVKLNGQIKALSRMFYVGTSRAAETVHVIWNETVVEIFTDDGEHIITYPRLARTGMYYGLRTPEGTPMKTAGKNLSAVITGTAARVISKGGYIGVLTNKIYASYQRNGEQITVTWDASTVTISDANAETIAQYPKPEHRRGWHGSHQRTPSTKS